MILSCKSCEKKFVVPDNAIPATGRLVQCSSCGNKWKQFPAKIEKKTIEKPFEIKTTSKKSFGSSKIKKRNNKKRTGPNLYSPEYLIKKHGIKISDNPITKENKISKENGINYGFYNFLFTLIVIVIFTLKVLHFSQEKVIELIPESRIYLDYLFESIKNIKEIIHNFFASY